MGVLNVLLGLVMTVFGVLQIILFFKIWGMTNDIRKIKNKCFSELGIGDIKIPTKLPSGSVDVNGRKNSGIITGSVAVEIKTGREVSVYKKNPDGTYECYADGGVCIGNLKEEELSY